MDDYREEGLQLLKKLIGALIPKIKNGSVFSGKIADENLLEDRLIEVMNLSDPKKGLAIPPELLKGCLEIINGYIRPENIRNFLLMPAKTAEKFPMSFYIQRCLRKEPAVFMGYSKIEKLTTNICEPDASRPYSVKHLQDKIKSEIVYFNVQRLFETYFWGELSSLRNLGFSVQMQQPFSVCHWLLEHYGDEIDVNGVRLQTLIANCVEDIAHSNLAGLKNCARAYDLAVDVLLKRPGALYVSPENVRDVEKIAEKAHEVTFAEKLRKAEREYNVVSDLIPKINNGTLVMGTTLGGNERLGNCLLSIMYRSNWRMGLELSPELLKACLEIIDEHISFENIREFLLLHDQGPLRFPMHFYMQRCLRKNPADFMRYPKIAHLMVMDIRNPGNESLPYSIKVLQDKVKSEIVYFNVQTLFEAYFFNELLSLVICGRSGQRQEPFSVSRWLLDQFDEIDVNVCGVGRHRCNLMDRLIPRCVEDITVLAPKGMSVGPEECAGAYDLAVDILLERTDALRVLPDNVRFAQGIPFVTFPAKLMQNRAACVAKDDVAAMTAIRARQSRATEAVQLSTERERVSLAKSTTPFCKGR